VDRDRQGVIRVFQGTAAPRTSSEPVMPASPEIGHDEPGVGDWGGAPPRSDVAEAAEDREMAAVDSSAASNDEPTNEPAKKKRARSRPAPRGGRAPRARRSRKESKESQA
jgi:hypothetical protein